MVWRKQKELEEQNKDAELGSFTKFPDLLMMDGGKGQVNIALQVLEELQLDIPVCGMVKDDNHSTRGLYYQNEEIPIDSRSEGFKLITRIQDEAHRFAIEYHRSLRSKAQVHSVLDEIPGSWTCQKKGTDADFRSIEKSALRRSGGAACRGWNEPARCRRNLSVLPHGKIIKNHQNKISNCLRIMV